VTHPNADRAASRHVADALRAQIASGAYPPGSKIPSYRQLRDAHHVAQNTAQAAVRLLAAEGLVEIRPASGAYVRGVPDGENLTVRAELANLRAVLRRSKQDLAAAETAVTSLLARLPAEGQAP
jgi:DNA-binding FadR family transcriptional regulator